MFAVAGVFAVGRVRRKNHGNATPARQDPRLPRYPVVSETIARSYSVSAMSRA